MIKPPEPTDRRIAGTGEPVLVEYAQAGKLFAGAPERTTCIEAESLSRSPVRSNKPS